ncbi:MAG: hypothetical protein JOY51_07545, partial [Nevskia sp.]|nr:hypothetical protein [Nevskia sp.]
MLLRSHALRSWCLPAAAALLLGACSSGPQLRDYQVSGEAVELKEVPYFAQDGQQGAPAALAMQLGAIGVQAAPADLASLVVDRQAGEVTPAAVRAVPAHYGRVGYVMRSRQLDLDLVREVQAG